MTTARLTSFTDGVVAIIITIMVLELPVPKAPGMAALQPLSVLFAAYALSFVKVGIYWSQHHNMLHAARKVSGPVLLANLFFLFWLTLFPLMIRWIDDAGVTPWPVASFGAVLVGAAVSYLVLERALIRAEGAGSVVKRAVGGGAKELISFALYLASIPAAFVSPFISVAIFFGVSILWLVPDRRFERQYFERSGK